MTPETLEIELTNHTTTPTVFATVTGLAIDRQNSWFLLKSDGKTPYYPSSPPSPLQPLSENCAIPLGKPGTSISITIPRIAGGRIYISIGKPIVFLLNPGPALVEPSVTNPSDQNYETQWSFMEFTYNHDQLYANISYVDFIGFPIALTLITSAGDEKKVLGLPKSGPETIAGKLREQAARDGQKWGDLVVYDKLGNLLRILSPNQGIVLNRSLFEGYFEPYIEEVWTHYLCHELKVDTQCQFGIVSGTVDPSTQRFKFTDTTTTSSTSKNNTEGEAGEEFNKPTTQDIFNASSGPFQTGANPLRNAIIPRLNAAFNRTVLLDCECEIPARRRKGFYTMDVTNHYARLVHEVNVDGKGYAHPYDDVAASGGGDHSGFVNDGAPRKLVVIVGGE